jgi:hypothetical protein
MPIADAYTDAALDAVVSALPASGGHWNLYASNPDGLADPTTVELTGDGGYAPVAFAPSDFAAASGNAASTTVPVDFGTSTDAYSDVANYYGITDSAGVLAFSDVLDTPIAINDVGGDPSFTPTLSFGDD